LSVASTQLPVKPERELTGLLQKFKVFSFSGISLAEISDMRRVNELAGNRVLATGNSLF
jgi:hypothetical protein